MRVAIVYDRVNKWGGAERVLLALHEIWPEAPLFTAVYDKKKTVWADVFDVKPSFLRNLPHEFLPWATPIAFETFNFDAFDIVISVTSAEAKNIITKPNVVHICYCLTPTRYLWSARKEYEASGVEGSMLRILAPRLRKWDLVASSRPDYYIAISNTVKERVETYYHREVTSVIYPPVDTEKFKINKTGDYFLTVSRLVGYKRGDLLIDAFNKLGWPLVIVGEGRDKARLKDRAAKNIRFVGAVSEEELVKYYQSCRAFVYAGVEDFGIAAVEAQAAGKPVVAFKQGAMAEIVISGKTGELFERQSGQSITEALKKVRSRWYDSVLCRENAERFSRARFVREMKETVARLYNKKTV